MRAMIQTRYGPPSVLQLRDVAKPSPRSTQILVKIHATTVTAADYAFRSGVPLMARLFTGVLKPSNPILGGELTGVVEAVGDDVTQFRVGDRVFGDTGAAFGAYAEYACLTEGDAALAVMPEGMSFAEAASLPGGFLTALPFLRDEARLQAGQHILINGASGSVGSAAVQLAKHMGAKVTAVCSGANTALVSDLGADLVIDYTKEDFARYESRFDVIFDAVGKRTFGQCKGALKEGGCYLTTVPSLAIFWQTFWTPRFGSKRAAIAMTGLRPPKLRADELTLLKTLVASGELRPVIDRCYPLEQTADAHAYVEQGHKKGNVVIQVADVR